jgi:hypothetical protein
MGCPALLQENQETTGHPKTQSKNSDIGVCLLFQKASPDSGFFEHIN